MNKIAITAGILVATVVTAATAIGMRHHEPPPAATPPAPIRSMTLLDLGYFKYDALDGGVIPDDVKALDGSKVRLRGFPMPQVQSEKVTEFMLSPFIMCCGFAPPPGVQQMAVVTLKGPGIDFSPDEIWIEGTLHVKEVREDNYTTQIFTLDSDAKSITPISP